MWISKREYNDMKNRIEYLEGKRSDLKHQLYRTRAELGVARRYNLKFYTIDVILSHAKKASQGILSKTGSEKHI